MKEQSDKKCREKGNDKDRVLGKVEFVVIGLSHRSAKYTMAGKKKERTKGKMERTTED